MPAELTLSLSTLLGFLLVFARAAGVFVFVPFPGMSKSAAPARVMLALCLTLALAAEWPHVDASITPAGMLGWMLGEASLGIAIGLPVALMLEIFSVAAQVAGLPAGFGFASTIDPNTQADSGVLLVFGQLSAGMLFFALGFDREVIRILCRNLQANPPGSFELTRPMVEQLVHLGSEMFATGLRLALPVVALLALIDVALALLGRINAQLQLLTVAFPIKMLVAMLMLAWITVMLPAVFRGAAGRMFTALETSLGN